MRMTSPPLICAKHSGRSQISRISRLGDAFLIYACQLQALKIEENNNYLLFNSCFPKINTFLQLNTDMIFTLHRFRDDLSF